MSSSLCSSLLPSSPSITLNSNRKPFTPIAQTVFILRFPISFQRLAGPPSFQHLALRSHPQQQQSDSGSASHHSSDDNIVKLLPLALREIVALFQSVGDDARAKYQQLLYYGSQLPPLDPRFKDNEHRVRGCVSQVWVRAFPDPVDPSAVRFEADSDSALTKGLCALLVFGLSGSSPSVITSVPPDFVVLLGLRQSLTPSRNNGFLNMLLLMQKMARDLQHSEEEFDSNDEENNLSTNVNGWRPLDYAALKSSSAGPGENSSSHDEGVNSEVGSMNGRIVASEDEFNGIDSGALLKDGDVDGDRLILGERGGGRGERIKKLLETALSPAELDIEDISHLHAGHAGIGGGRSGETHFNVRVVSKEFEGKSLIKRHRLVYELLRDELQSGLHSLSIVTNTPSETQMSS